MYPSEERLRGSGLRKFWLPSNRSGVTCLTNPAEGGGPDWQPAPTTYSCAGFGPPMNNGPVTVKGNRALPLKGQLRDADNNIITDAGVTAPPVLQVLFDSGMGGDPIDVTSDTLPVGQGTDGNQFVFDPITQEWRYNLSSKNYTAEGTYYLLMMSGNETEYRIDPTCTATFVRE